MADFLEAYKRTAVYEGGYANVKGDNGGETYAGIARNYWKGWEGWKIVDANKPLKHNQKINNAALESHVRTFYKRNFWDVIWGDRIDNQDVAFRLYDFGVNAGTIASIKQIQKVLKAPQTGKMSGELLELINDPKNQLLL